MHEIMEGNKFFETYYSKSRFAVETCLAIVSVGSNALMLLLTRGNRNRRHYAYFAFFRNLLIANVLSAMAQWFTNNLMFLLQDNLRHIKDHCHLMLLLQSANVLSKIFGTVSIISLLGLSVIHCLAVCYPITYIVHMKVTRVHIVIAVSWILTTVIASMEIVICVSRLTVGNCTSEAKFITTMMIVDTDITVVMLTLLYAVIVGLCLRIAAEIRRLQNRLNRLCWTDNLQQERGTFRSIVGLTITMIVFIFPYHVLYFLSMNFDLPKLSNNSAVLYYMNLLPYIKFASDPIFFCRKRIVQWRNVGCIFSFLVCCKKPTLNDSREDRGLMEDNNFSGVTVTPVADESIGYIATSTTLPTQPEPRDLRVALEAPAGFLTCANTSLV